MLLINGGKWGDEGKTPDVMPCVWQSFKQQYHKIPKWKKNWLES